MPTLFRGCFGIALGKGNNAENGERLGKRHLGRYAYENRMPDWLYRLLEDAEKQHLEDAPCGIVDILGTLLEQDPAVEAAYLCHHATRYVSKVRVKGRDEGNNFCGYHNIQMLVSHIKSGERLGHEKFAGGIPTIWQIQDMIEKAWDQGFNDSGRVQTGGIRGTRKHIGTPETQALFRSLDVPCQAHRFQNTTDGRKAYEQLLDSVEQYFSSPATWSQARDSRKVQITALPPIYLQRPRHSMTIIGIEKRKGGSRNLLVFDPAYCPSRNMMQIVSGDSDFKSFKSLVKPYRRGKTYLGNFTAFETLCLASDIGI